MVDNRVPGVRIPAPVAARRQVDEMENDPSVYFQRAFTEAAQLADQQIEKEFESRIADHVRVINASGSRDYRVNGRGGSSAMNAKQASWTSALDDVPSVVMASTATGAVCHADYARPAQGGRTAKHRDPSYPRPTKSPTVWDLLHELAAVVRSFIRVR